MEKLRIIRWQRWNNFLLQDPIEDKVNDLNPDVTFLGASEQGKIVVFNIPVDRYQFDTRSLGQLIVANLAGLLAYRNTSKTKGVSSERSCKIESNRRTVRRPPYLHD